MTIDGEKIFEKEKNEKEKKVYQLYFPSPPGHHLLFCAEMKQAESNDNNNETDSKVQPEDHWKSKHRVVFALCFLNFVK